MYDVSIILECCRTKMKTTTLISNDGGSTVVNQPEPPLLYQKVLKRVKGLSRKVKLRIDFFFKLLE